MYSKCTKLSVTHATLYPRFEKIYSGKCDFFYPPSLLYSIDSAYIKMLITYFHFIFVFAKFFRVTFFYLKSGENNNDKKKGISEFHISSVVFLLIVTRSKLHRKKLRGEKMNLVKNYLFLSLSLSRSQRLFSRNAKREDHILKFCPRLIHF